MTEQQIRALGAALTTFLQPFLFCCDYTQTFDHLDIYCRGLLSDLPRKSVEPIALASGVPVRTLQEFLKDHGWDQDEMIDIAQADTAKLLPSLPDGDGLGTVGIFDETSFPKSGKKTPGVGRQWCGRLGKVDNCVVTVHLGVARGPYTALIDGQLFLPKDWSDDRTRCREAGIPDEVVYRSKWRIALEEYDRAIGNGVVMDWVTFDEGYGSKPGFLDGLDSRKQRFAGEVPKSMSCVADDEQGRPIAKTQAEPAECVLAHALGGTAVAVRVCHTGSVDVVWQAVERVVWLKDNERGGFSRTSYRLVAAYNSRSTAVKYIVSNAAADVPLAEVVRAALRRAPVEQAFSIGKGELGLGHYEGRNYVGMMRHIAICCLMGLFLAKQASQTRQSNPEVTVHQVSRAMGAIFVLWQMVCRGLDLLSVTVKTIAYHQKRNAAARESHKKSYVVPTFLIVPRSRISFISELRVT